MVKPPVSASAPRLHKRLRSLAVLELLNIPLQAILWFGILDFPPTLANVTGFVLCSALLVQGAAYWIAKLRQLREWRDRLPGIRYFAVARPLNVIALVFGVWFTGWAVLVQPGSESWLGLGLTLFAVLEYVNYFRVQLMHDTAADLRRLIQRGLRPAHLARDLAAHTADGRSRSH
jgi:hypothetical protein